MIENIRPNHLLWLLQHFIREKKHRPPSSLFASPLLSHFSMGRLSLRFFQKATSPPPPHDFILTLALSSIIPSTPSNVYVVLRTFPSFSFYSTLHLFYSLVLLLFPYLLPSNQTRPPPLTRSFSSGFLASPVYASMYQKALASPLRPEWIYFSISVGLRHVL